MTTLDLWTQAKLNVPACGRCDDWNERGLSNRCPECDGLIIAEHERLKEIQADPMGMGVLFETGSAKFIKMQSSEEIKPAMFVSSWDQASHVEYSKWRADPDSILEANELMYVKKTIKFIALALFYPKDA